MPNLQELNAPDNPFLWKVPAELGSLQHLRHLDLRNTAVFEIPREFALLQKTIRDINLEGCPLKPNLREAYGFGYLSLFAYLKRKNDRRIYKKDLIRQFREDIYPFDPMEQLEATANLIFKNLKDFTSHELRKLTRHAPRILPHALQDINVALIRNKILEICEEDENMQEVGRLQLKLRGMYPESPLEFAGHIAHDIYYGFDATDLAQLFHPTDRPLLFDPDYRNVNLDSLAANLRQLRHVRWYKSILKRILNVYRSSDQMNDEKADLIFSHLLESAHHEKELIDSQLESVLPPDLDDCLAMVEEEMFFQFKPMITLRGNEEEEEEEIDLEDGVPGAGEADDGGDGGGGQG